MVQYRIGRNSLFINGNIHPLANTSPSSPKSPIEPHLEQEDQCSGSLLQSCLLLILFNRKKENKLLGEGGGSASAAHNPSASQLWKKWHLPRPLSVLFGFNHVNNLAPLGQSQTDNLKCFLSSSLYFFYNNIRTGYNSQS